MPRLSEKVPISMDRQMRDQLKALAERRREETSQPVSVADVVRQAIKEFLERADGK